MYFDVGYHLFWSNKCVMCWDIDELENTCDQLHIFAQAISLSPKFALYFKQNRMIHEMEIYIRQTAHLHLSFRNNCNISSSKTDVMPRVIA